MMREGQRPPLRAKTAGHLSGRDRPPRWPAWETYSLRRNEAYRPVARRRRRKGESSGRCCTCCRSFQATSVCSSPHQRTPRVAGWCYRPSPTEPLIAGASRLADSAVLRQVGDGSGFPPSHTLCPRPAWSAPRAFLWWG